MASSSDYQKEYYRRNREEILKQRKKRYQEDKDYREGLKTKALQKHHANKPPKKNRLVVNADGKTFYTTGYLSKMTGINMMTIHYYIRHGIIPNAKIVRCGWKIYTEEQIEIIRDAFAPYGTKRKSGEDLEQIKLKIQKGFNACQKRK